VGGAGRALRAGSFAARDAGALGGAGRPQRAGGDAARAARLARSRSFGRRARRRRRSTTPSTPWKALWSATGRSSSPPFGAGRPAGFRNSSTKSWRTS
jgi:hypothetical protein